MDRSAIHGATNPFQSWGFQCLVAHVSGLVSWLLGLEHAEVVFLLPLETFCLIVLCRPQRRPRVCVVDLVADSVAVDPVTVSYTHLTLPTTPYV